MQLSFKKALEWAEHLDFVFSWGWKVFLALGGGVLLGAIAHTFAIVRGWWLAAVLLLGSGLLFLLMHWATLCLARTVRVKKEQEDEKKKEPGIAAKFLEIHFVPRVDTVPLGMLDELMSLVGRKTYHIDCDVLTEVHVVNEMDTAVTIQGFDAKVIIEGVQYEVKEVRDLRDWQMQVDRETRYQGFRCVKTEYLDLDGLMAKIGDKPLVKGVGYQGWLHFELLQTDRRTAEKVEFSLEIIDAFGKRHGVVSAERMKSDTKLVYARGLRGH